MANYNINTTPAARRDLHKTTDRNITNRVTDKIVQLQNDPWTVPGTRKLRTHKNLYRVRVGEHRVVFTVNKAAREITVFAVGPRATVYKTIIMRAQQ